MAIRLVAVVSFLIGLTRNMAATRISRLPAIKELVNKVHVNFLLREVKGGASGSTNIAFVPISVFIGRPKRLVAAPFALA
ncbi:hypothetical protein D3C74_335550 [compost metagenome]